MSWLTQLSGAPDINLRKLAKGDVKEKEKAKKVVADILEMVMPVVIDERSKEWFDSFVNRLPIPIIRLLHEACARRLGKPIPPDVI